MKVRNFANGPSCYWANYEEDDDPNNLDNGATGWFAAMTTMTIPTIDRIA